MKHNKLYFSAFGIFLTIGSIYAEMSQPEKRSELPVESKKIVPEKHPTVVAKPAPAPKPIPIREPAIKVQPKPIMRQATPKNMQQKKASLAVVARQKASPMASEATERKFTFGNKSFRSIYEAQHYAAKHPKFMAKYFEVPKPPVKDTACVPPGCRQVGDQKIFRSNEDAIKYEVQKKLETQHAQRVAQYKAAHHGQEPPPSQVINARMNSAQGKNLLANMNAAYAARNDWRYVQNPTTKYAGLPDSTVIKKPFDPRRTALWEQESTTVGDIKRFVKQTEANLKQAADSWNNYIYAPEK